MNQFLLHHLEVPWLEVARVTVSIWELTQIHCYRLIIYHSFLACTNKLPAHPCPTENPSNVHLNHLKEMTDIFLEDQSATMWDLLTLSSASAPSQRFPLSPWIFNFLCLAHPAPDTSPCGHCNCKHRQDFVSPPLLLISIKKAVLHSHFLEISCSFWVKWYSTEQD